MNEAHQNDVLRKVFEVALAPNMGSVDDPSPDDKTHPVNDEDLLIEWSLGQLEQDSHTEIIEHLANCPFCRRELVAMIRAGAIVLPITDDEDQPEMPDSTEAKVVTMTDHIPWFRRKLFFAITGLAASIILLLAWGVFRPDSRDATSVIAMARQDLQQKRPTAAFRRVVRFLEQPQQLPASLRAEANQILEESAYKLAREELGQRHFSEVSAIEDQVARHGHTSGRLFGLRIQAESKQMVELPISKGKSLLNDFYYDRSGLRILIKGIPEINKRLKQQLAEAVDRFPDSLELRLNYGHVLMEQNDFSRAEEQFAEAVRIDSGSALAQTGLGLALFQQERNDKIAKALDDRIAKALVHFRKAVELEPDDPDANLNLAVCLVRSNREDAAQPYFSKGGLLQKDPN